ncbi:MAG: dihydrodipicolinate synthase family protein [Planctomycetota bacterium]
MDIQHLTGLIAPPPTAMNRDGSVNPDAVERQLRALRRAGVRGAFVCGTTGESVSLSVSERICIAERWAEARPPDFTLIVHVGHCSLKEAKALAEHAQEIGADAVAAMAPPVFPPACVGDLVAFCRCTAQAAPELPFYYYHIPSVTGVDFRMLDFLRQAADRIPSLAGMKFTYEHLMDYERCLRFRGGRYDMLFGRDEMLLSALALGARGAVGTTYNFAAPLYLRIMDAFERGDLEAARADQHRANEMVAVMGRFGGVRAAKAMMRFAGLDCGPPRLPLRALDEEEMDALRGELDAVGFFDYCSGA